MDDKRRWKQVTQEPGSGSVAGPAVFLGDYVNVFDLQQITWLGPFNVNRAGQWVPHLAGETVKVIDGHVGIHLPVRGVPSLQ